MTVAHVKVPPPTTNCQSLKASFSKNPLGVHRPRNPRCCTADAQWAIQGGAKCTTHRHQEQFMAKLHEELGQCLVRARLCGVMGTAQSLSRGRRHSQACSSS